MLIVKGLMPERQSIRGQFPRQELFRERGTLVRQERLVAHENQPSVETLTPQGVDGLSAGLPAAYDENGGAHGLP
jgi:hypothetical protein